MAASVGAWPRSWARIPLLWALLALLLSPVQAAPAARFGIEQQDGISWLTTPDHRRFFSLGVCCVDPGLVWDQYDVTKPAYAGWRNYPDPLAWADSTVVRLKSWGFTTVGAWSDLTLLRKSRQMDMPFTVMMPLAMGTEGPWKDMWDPQRVRRMEAIAREAIVPVRDDPHCIGYFTDNEQGWWNIGLWRSTLQQAPQSGQRRRLLALLRQRYGSDWRRLGADFVAVGASSFSALERGGMLFLRPGGAGLSTVHAFAGVVATRYYQLTRDIVRRLDPRGLVLGDRYQSFYYPAVAQAAGPYVDVVSTNINPFFADGSGTHWYLDTLHRLTHRPVMITEFYACANENSSGDPNSSSGFLTLPTQAERTSAFERSLQWFSSCPYVVGADWFQYYDEPPHGRGDGENYNMGLVDVNDHPYDGLSHALATLDLMSLKRQSTASRHVAPGLPPAPDHPMEGSDDKAMMVSWDRLRGYVAPAEGASLPQADLYACWDAGHLYVGVHALDIVEPDGWQGNKVPEQDRMVLRLEGLNPPVQVRLGAGRAPQFNGAPCVYKHHSGVEHDCRNVTMLEIPAARLGLASLAAGQRVKLQVRLAGCGQGWSEAWTVDDVLGGPP